MTGDECRRCVICGNLCEKCYTQGDSLIVEHEGRRGWAHLACQAAKMSERQLAGKGRRRFDRKPVVPELWRFPGDVE